MKIEIKRLGINGEGIGEVDGKVCFVEGALPGEIIEASITQSKSKFLRAKCEKVIVSSLDRVVPKCPYFGKCGGCDIQHMTSGMQLQFKSQKVGDSLHKISHMDVDISDVIRLNDFGYRNKMVFPIQTQNNHVTIGMYEANSHRIVEIDQCLLAHTLINDVLDVFRRYSSDTRRDASGYRFLVVRTNGVDVLVTIVSNTRLDLLDFYDTMKSKFNKCGVSNLVSNSDMEILDGEYYHEYGIEALGFEWRGISYSVNNLGFLQVNNAVKDELYKIVENNIDSHDTVIDAYCGAGLMTAICAQKAKYVVGLEINSAAIASANRLIVDNNITNAQFIRCDVKDEISKCLQKFDNITLILDPPRAGCEMPVLSRILDSDVKKIIYISCDPATLARDLAVLKAKYQVVSVQPLDMFPQTKHCETICILEKVKDE